MIESLRIDEYITMQVRFVYFLIIRNKFLDVFSNGKTHGSPTQFHFRDSPARLIILGERKDGARVRGRVRKRRLRGMRGGENVTGKGDHVLS